VSRKVGLVDEPRPLMQVRDEAEGNAICERLRAAGIRCAVAPLPDANSFVSIWAGQAPTVLKVLVNESEMDDARAVVAEYESSLPRTGEARSG
jgi:hypothetical protein